MFALYQTSLTLMHCGDCSAASAFGDELLTLADEKPDQMRYRARSIAALQMALGSLVGPDIEVSAKTVAELRKVTGLAGKFRGTAAVT